MTLWGLLLSMMAILIFNGMDTTSVLSAQGGGGLSVQRGPGNTYSAKWTTECAVGVKFIIQCSQCECIPDGSAVNCTLVPCQTHRFKPYNAKQIPADQLVCVPDAVHTICEECFCFQPNQPGQMCVRMQCPPMTPK